jgi:hypothetical protein
LNLAGDFEIPLHLDAVGQFQREQDSSRMPPPKQGGTVGVEMEILAVDADLPS